MKKLIAFVSLAASTLMGASLPPMHSSVQGDYVEARTADVYTGPCLKASGTLGYIHSNAYPVKSVIIVDERANPAQRLALKSFAQKMAGDLLQDVVRVDVQPIEFTMDGDNVHSAKAKLTAGTLAAIETRAMQEGDHLCHNEETWYPPLTKLDHSMAAYTLAHKFTGPELGTTWSYPEKRSAFVGSFHYNE
jgi:hypothetical protein